MPFQNAQLELCVYLLSSKSADVYTKLYNSFVWPVVDYDSAIFSCVNAVYNRAM